MAALKYTKNTTEKFDIKGYLNDEATTVTYEDKDEGEIAVTLQDYLDKFASQYVQITIQTKSEEELVLENNEE